MPHYGQKEDECLIIYLKDNNELYKITNIGENKDIYYLILKFQNSVGKKEEVSNPVISTGIIENPNGISYNLSNKHVLENLPVDVNDCKCDIIKNFDLGIKFTLYVEKENGWEVYDAQRFLVQE